MSASLVGSEMCIRDSASHLPKGGSTPRTPLPPKPANRAGQEVASKPVSYTHLTLPTICSV
eukprot:12427165-Alexandrium_andersonii.AAC.1